MLVNARRGLHIGLGFQSCKVGVRELYAVAVLACVCHPLRDGPAAAIGVGRYGVALAVAGYARVAMSPFRSSLPTLHQMTHQHVRSKHWAHWAPRQTLALEVVVNHTSPVDDIRRSPPSHIVLE